MLGRHMRFPKHIAGICLTFWPDVLMPDLFKSLVGGICGWFGPRLALRLIEEFPELSAGGLEGSLLFLGVAVMENGPTVSDQVGQNLVHWRLSERRRVVEFGDELSA